MKPLGDFRRVLSCLLLAACMTGASAHELTENRATLVLRDQTHLSMTLVIGYAAILHRSLAPERSFEEFVLAYSALPPEAFRATLLKTQARLQDQIRLVTGDGRTLALGNWTWPAPEDIQGSLRERAMQIVVAPAAHAHEEPVEVRAEFRAPKPITSLRATFPESFQRVLVVSYLPKQVWVEPRGSSPEIRF